MTLPKRVGAVAGAVKKRTEFGPHATGCGYEDGYENVSENRKPIEVRHSRSWLGTRGAVAPSASFGWSACAGLA